MTYLTFFTSVIDVNVEKGAKIKILIMLVISGLSLLKVSGRMVYSTCSLNPVENEAVVAEVLKYNEKLLMPI